MKYFISSTLLFCSFLTFAQSDIEQKLKTEFWTNPSKEFQSIDVPEKWKNESAVVLASRREFLVDLNAYSQTYTEKLNLHFRIKLLDNAAVKDYSELSFDEQKMRTNLFGRAKAYRFIGITVIKPDQSKHEVDLTKAVQEDDVSDKELKIAVPDLTPGDIIDYFVAIKVETKEPPIFGDDILLESKYPVASHTVVITLPHQLELLSKSYNGAPGFKMTKIKRDVTYTLSLDMQQKAPNLKWEYEYRTTPQVRYNIVFEGRKPILEDVASDALRQFKLFPTDVGYMEDFININFKSEKKNHTKVVKELYYLLRNPIYKSAYFSMSQQEPLSEAYVPNEFFRLFDNYLTRAKISHDLYIGSQRSYGEMHDAVDLSNFEIMLKVNTNPPIYITRPNPFTMPNEIDASIEGMKSVSTVHGQNLTLPTTKAEQNVTTSVIKASLLTDDITKVNITRDITVQGHNKVGHQYDIFTNYDYLQEYDQKKYLAESSRKMGALIKEYKEEKQKFEQLKTQNYNERDKRMKEGLEETLEGKVNDFKLEIKQIGMWDDHPNTEYTETFSLENMTKKAGPNIIVELGKLIGQQADIPDNQKERTRDIYMEYPRTFADNITFEIPAGYHVEGVESLNKSVVSDAGGFESTAVLNGNTLTVKTKKFYAKYYYPAAEWSKIINFLNAATEFYHAKILLKKG